MKKFLAYLKGWRGMALIAYAWLVLMAWVIVYVDISSPELKRRFYIVSIAEIILLTLIYLCPKLLQFAEGLHIQSEPQALTNRSRLKVFMKSWLVSFAYFFVLYIIFYPGGLSPDNIGQYAQAMGYEGYSDHHPVLQTLFAYTLPLRLTGGWIGSINLFQLVIFSLVLAYMSLVLSEYGSRRYAKYSLIYILLNPATLGLSITPQKDTSFAIAALLVMIFTLRIYFTKGKWLENIPRIIIFLAVLTACTIFRHNAILFTLPLLLAISTFVRKRYALLMLICFALMVYAVRVPLYRSLNVTYPENRKIEMLGLPMAVIGNAVKEQPEYLDQDILDFAYSVASRDIWEKDFDVYKGYDAIKYVSGVDNAAIERAEIKDVLAFALRCLKQAPVQSLRGALAVTSLVYGIAGAPVSPYSPVVFENKFGLANNNFFRLTFLEGFVKKIFPPTIRSVYVLIESGNFSLQTVIIILNYIIMAMFKHVFGFTGVLNLAVIIFILAKLKFNKLHDWKRLGLVLPMLAYNYGTMLLLSGNISRVFYYSFLIFPIILLILLKTDSEEQQ